TNPLIRVPDLEVLAEIAHQAGALLVVDNTVPTPALSQPMRWGADVVIYSATKNLSGHADVIGGVVVGRPSWVDGARAFARTLGPPERARAGIGDGLVRCSVGLEHSDDLLEDFQRALTSS